MSDVWDLQEASWKGITFHIEAVEDQWQRRVAEHQYPGRAGANLEDLDREPVRVSLQALVFGQRYKDELRALIAAFEEGGEGTLVHPVLGTITANCTAMRVRHDQERMNLASLDMTFVENQTDQAAFEVVEATVATAANEARASADAATAAVTLL